MKGIVDRIEGNVVVIEIDGQTQDINKNDVSSDIKVGDVVLLVSGKWITDETETKQRESKIIKLMDDVWEDD
ncbi:DUF3006 domain-containing protein [Paenibacillus sp. 2TAB26]|uniref:DUF3006 domain-containing protein n=1 Tax=Paenibacillus sp. 2TAB26 TaxID=3233005 RepID=UPI003F9B2F42